MDKLARFLLCLGLGYLIVNEQHTKTAAERFSSTLMAPEGAVHRERSQWFLQSANFSLTVLLVERSEPGAMC